MTSECPTNSNSETRKKRRRIVLTLHEKMMILKKIEQGRRYSSLAREYNCNESSIRTIKKCEKKIKNSINMLANSSCVKSTFLSRRDSILEQMEHLLNVWIDEKISENVLLTTNMIREKARNIYDQLKTENPQNELSFCASKGWFDRFKRRANLQSEAVVSEAIEEEGDNFKRTFCWTKIPQGEPALEEENNIQTEIEKIISLSNMIERERKTDTEQVKILDTVTSHSEDFRDKGEYARGTKVEVCAELEDTENEIEKADITSRNISEILKAAEYLKEKILREDPDLERSEKIRKEIDNIMNTYSDIEVTDKPQGNTAEISDSSLKDFVS